MLYINSKIKTLYRRRLGQQPKNQTAQNGQPGAGRISVEKNRSATTIINKRNETMEMSFKCDQSIDDARRGLMMNIIIIERFLNGR